MIDTGVIDLKNDSEVQKNIMVQCEVAINLADVIAFFVDGKEGINNVELMNAIELSGFRNGASVTLPVNEEEYLEELNKRRASSRYKESNDDVVMDTSNSSSF